MDERTPFDQPIATFFTLVAACPISGHRGLILYNCYRVGFSTVSSIVTEVCQAICRNLENMYLPEPTEQLWQKAEEGFRNQWQFPNCIGSVDGKHITIKCPPKTGSNYWCYSNKFSLVLMAIVGPDYRFIAVDIGGFGKNSDGGIFETSNMGKRFEENLMNVPKPKNLPNHDEPCPHVLIGDEAFSLKTYLMRPFPYKQCKTDISKEKYNTRLCRARRVVENAFGILAQKWRIFYRPIETKVETTILITLQNLNLELSLILRMTQEEQRGLHFLLEKNLLIILILEYKRNSYLLL
ncbi:hypothetical protein NQ315_002479 [Exocentrus adspersus]|uniref:DDE Tnp4 domain-containing protein n=1 Tax=Exocentrus adspersus TaxID=1586481 RepID=A0AAV8VL89_9CUCU|nr:hypothetical protein NQ315_002479 [Exocentrus adspersus]